MKYLNELNLEELKEVYNKNQKLQEAVFDDMFSNVDFWNSEYLNCWERGAIRYCIGWDRGTYFEAKNRDGFLKGLKKAQKIYGFLADTWNEKIEYAEKLLSKLDYLYYNSSVENYDRVEARIDELIEDLEHACYKRFMSEYEHCFNSESQLDYFLDFFVAERMNNNYYVNDDLELFEHVEFERKFS